MGDFFMKRIFKTALITILCGVIFFGGAYAYLDYNIDKTAKEAEQKNYDVQYEYTPENCGIAFVLPQDNATIVYLDFDNMCIRLLNVKNFDRSLSEYYGYTADYIIEIDYELIAGIVDRVGGIELEYDGEKMRYTGVQVIDIIARGQMDDIEKKILLQIFEKIAKNSFSKDDLVYIIENSKGDLSFADCMDWLDYLKDMSRRVSFIN